VRAGLSFGSSLTVFPNKAVFTNRDKESRISLMDLSGKVMQRQHLSPGEKCLLGADVPEGMYVIEAMSGGQRYTQKFMKSGKARSRLF
jgi:hypothetical protein